MTTVGRSLASEEFQSYTDRADERVIIFRIPAGYEESDGEWLASKQTLDLEAWR